MTGLIRTILKRGVHKGHGQLVLENEIEKKYIPISGEWYMPFGTPEESVIKVPSKLVNKKIVPIIQIT